MPDSKYDPYFALFSEVGIINQIGSTFLEAHLPDGVLISHFGVMNHLIRGRDGDTPLMLARAFQVAKTTMTHTLAGLQTRGLVIARPNPDDKRSKRIWLTPAGRDFHRDALEQLAPLMAALSDRFSPEKAAEILPLLATFRTVLDSFRDEQD